MNKQISFPPSLHAAVELPRSKSLSARALVLAALAGAEGWHLEHLAVCDDTEAMQRALRSGTLVRNVGAAGTAMRFLTAYFAALPPHAATEVRQKKIQLAGTARMHARPIGILVEALRAVGAEIRYLGREGCPPLEIVPRRLHGGALDVEAGVSSQYISALLMVAPLMEGGLRLRLRGELLSAPYINMTLAMMQHFGAEVERVGGAEISARPVPYAKEGTYCVESDWSAASYWYEMMALCPQADAEVRLHGLRRESLQGDAAVARLFEALGVKTSYRRDGVVLRKGRPRLRRDEVWREDLRAVPDLAQTLVVACVLQGQRFAFSGLQNLRLKETDRLRALQTELSRFGATLHASPDGLLAYGLDASPLPVLHAPTEAIQTYDDHRMAMAFAPAAWRFPGLVVAEAEVVSKSYPDFWAHLEAL